MSYVNLGYSNLFKQPSLCQLPYVWTGPSCIILYAVFPVTSSSSTANISKQGEQIYTQLHSLQVLMFRIFNLPKKVIINIQLNNAISTLSTLDFCFLFSLAPTEVIPKNRTHKGVGLVLQKGTLYLKDCGTSQNYEKSPQLCSFSGSLLHSLGCVLSALAISNDNGTSIIRPFELILIGLTARAKLRICIAIMMNNSLIHTPWLFIVAGRYRVNQLPFQQ